MADKKPSVSDESQAEEKKPDQRPDGSSAALGPIQGFDRQAYLKEVRNNLLKNLGLPEGTKPEQVARLLEIKARLKK